MQGFFSDIKIPEQADQRSIYMAGLRAIDGIYGRAYLMGFVRL
jgi:hypothetical protein